MENPIPFSPDPLTRILTTGYLHAKYASLLVLPLHLSADWSFSCIPYVTELADPRNIATALLYLLLLVALLAAQPWELLSELFLASPRAMDRRSSTGSKLTMQQVRTPWVVVFAEDPSGVLCLWMARYFVFVLGILAEGADNSGQAWHGACARCKETGLQLDGEKVWTANVGDGGKWEPQELEVTEGGGGPGVTESKGGRREGRGGKLRAWMSVGYFFSCRMDVGSETG